ncbi:MAG TPA: glutaminyl-peptide cyclotransferase [Thermoanaerobaculia bacterium]|nr:glutaminyl-peptide cyclotransferase [Thermoanaerobaculia bacterium]
MKTERPPSAAAARRLAIPLLLLIGCAVLAGWGLWQAARSGAEGMGAGGENGTEARPAPPAAAAAGAAGEPEAAAPEPVRRQRLRVLARYPHDPESFTQGLLLHGGHLYESTGRYGLSRLRRVEIESGRVLAERPLPEDWFGEGLALVPGEGGGRLVQLTWLEGVAPVWSLDGFERLGEHRYQGEGWGLCHDATVPGGRLPMTDGSSRLTFRDPATFAATGSVEVTLDGRPVQMLNELECLPDGRVLANVLGSDLIVEIAPATGHVTAILDASGLLTPAERAGADVLNGIAHDPADGTLLITGKLWPWVFRVEREGADESTPR